MSKEKPVIIVDAMGGDFAPVITVEGVCKMAAESNAHFILVGHEEKIKAELEKHTYNDDQISIVHTDEMISNHDNPRAAVKDKKNASVLLAARMLKEGKGDAMVSAGSTAAVVLAASLYIKRIPGVRRAAIGTIFPTLKEDKTKSPYAVVMDVGANINNTADDMVHYAYMGKTYLRELFDIEDPKIGLLNIGAEEHKGTDTLKEANKLLSSRDDLNFVGNIEGNDITNGKADVIVSEGIHGNIAMKSIEGVAESAKKLAKMAMKGKFIWKLGLFFLQGGIKNVLKYASYEEYGGAPIFGFDKLVVKSHGRCTAYAYKNGLRTTLNAVQSGMIDFMRDSISKFEADKEKSES
jgi:glycerol-3-phosphate acyltransferase PlsX